MFQSRNAEEHSHDQTLQAELTGVAIGGSMFGDGTVDEIRIERGKLMTSKVSGPVDVVFFGGKPSLLAVEDSRYKTVFHPPSEHNGKPIEGTDPFVVGELYLESLKEIIERAEQI